MPTPLHRIWFGEPFPEKYMAGMQHLRQLHPDRPVILWTDSKSQSAKSYRELQEKCTASNITLCNIRDYPHLLNYDLIDEELERAKQRRSHKKLHYVRASDIARISILYLMGGIYTDTDSKMLAPFPELNPKHGIYIKQTRHLNKTVYSKKLADESHPYYFKNVHYDFIAGEAGNPHLKLAADITRLDFQTHNKSDFSHWEKTDANSTLLQGTINLTGTALKWALNHAYQKDQLKFDHPDELIYDIESIMETGNDKSWLDDFEITEDNVMRKIATDKRMEKKYLTPWLKELKQARQHAFPIAQPSEKLPVDLPKPPEWDEYKYADFRYPSEDKFNSDDFIRYLQAKKQENNTSTSNIFAALSQQISINIPQPAAVPLPKFDFPKFTLDLTTLDLNLTTTEDIRKIYAEKGGSLFQQFRLFSCIRNKSKDDIIKMLEERAAHSPNGASSQTLAAIRRV